jgi:hypothetical protein
VEDLAKARATLEGRCLAAKAKPVDARWLMTSWVRILQEYKDKTVLNINPLAQVLGAYSDMYKEIKNLMESKPTP